MSRGKNEEKKFIVPLFERDEKVTLGRYAGQTRHCIYNLTFDGICWAVERNGIGQAFFPRPAMGARYLTEIGMAEVPNLTNFVPVMELFVKQIENVLSNLHNNINKKAQANG